MSAEWITHLGTAQVLINDCIADPSSELALQTLLTGIASVLFFFFHIGLIILNAWYGKFVTDNSRKHERARVIDVTVPLQCLVKDSKLILTEASKVTQS